MTLRTPNRAGGFTLIEMLVVIAIIGIVTAIGTSMFVTVTAAWNERRELAELDAQAQDVLEFIRRDIAATLASGVSGAFVAGESRTVKDDRTYPAAFHADDSLSIALSVDDPARGVSTPSRAGYRVERSGPTGRLLRTIGPISGEFPTGGAIEVIQARVQGFSVEYLSPRAGAVWSETWAGPGQPAAIRVSLALEHPVRPEFQVAHKAVIPIHVE